MKGMPKTEQERLQSGPIPGENYLSDTKNYPWHRPPKYTTLDKAIDHVIEHIFETKRAQTLMTVLEIGIPVSTVTSMYLQAGIGQGKWTPDFALLMAGPVAHIMQIMADGYNIKYDMGIDENNRVPTKAFFENMVDIKKPAPTKEMKEEAKEVVKPEAPDTEKSEGESDMMSKGLMGGL